MDPLRKMIHSKEQKRKNHKLTQKKVDKERNNSGNNHFLDFLARLRVRDDPLNLHDKIVVEAKHSRSSASVCHLLVLHMQKIPINLQWSFQNRSIFIIFKNRCCTGHVTVDIYCDVIGWNICNTNITIFKVYIRYHSDIIITKLSVNVPHLTP